MKQSTFSAVMANSIKNLLQGYTKGIRFVAVLTVLLTMGIGQAWGETIYTNTGATGTTNGITASGNINAKNGNTAPSFGLTSANNKTITLTGLNLTSYTNVAMTFDYQLAKSGSSFSSLTVTQYNSSNASISTNNITGSNNTSYKKATIALQSACTKITIVCNPAGSSTYNTYVDNINITGDLASLPWVLKGSFDNWGDGKEMTEVSTGKATATLDLAANTQYELKFVNGSNWLGNSGTINADISNWVFKTTESSNVKLNSGLGGTFTFTIDYSASTTQPKVSVTYPRKDIYMACGSTWCDATPTFFAHAWRNGGSETYDVKLVQAPCESSVYIAENIPAYCSHVIFTRQTPGSTELVWNGANFWNQSEDITIGTNNLFTCTGWSNGKGTFSGGTYTPPTYKITFSGNGNTGGSMSNVTGIPCEGSTTLAPNGYTRTGYTFNGWKDAGGNTYADKATISNITSNITLTAQWTPITYDVKFNANNGSGSMSNQTFTYDAAQNLTANTFSRIGYLFAGWNTKADGSGTSYADKASVNNLSSTNGATVNLYAQWTPITYYVKFNGNGSTSGSMSNQTFKYGTAQNLTANKFTRTGYKFAGWSTQEDGSGTSYADNASVNNLSTTNGAIVNLYAKWTKVHTITWKVNSTTHSTTTVDDGDPLVLPSPNPSAPSSCSDKEFMGWTESATVNNDGTSITYISTSTKPDGDKTYHAVFATEEEVPGGTVDASSSVTISSYADDNSWKDATAYTSVTLDECITASASKGTHTGKYYESGENWRFYQNENAQLTISAATGCTIKTVKVTYTVSNSGVLKYNGTNVSSGSNVTVNAASAIFSVGNTGSATNGQVRVTKIEVTYSKPGGTTIKHSDYVTSCTPQYTITLDLDGGVFDETPDGWTKVDENTYTQVVNENTAVTLPTPTKKGYTYKGWRKNSLDNPVTSITATETATYTAVYDCALNTVGISGTYALTVGDVFELVATAYDSNGDVLTCPANTTYSWERYNSVDGVWEAITDDNSDGDDAKLTFNNCQIANCGTYRCHVSYGECEASSHTTAADGGFNVHCFHLKGDFEGDWGIEYAFNHTDEEGIATLTLELISGRTHYFKIYDGISQYGNGGEITASVTGWTYETTINSNTKLQTGADGSYVFTLNYTQLINNSTNILVLDVTYPPTDQASGKTIYYDNLVHNWQNVYYRIGHNRDNGDGTWGWNQNQKMTLVPGTSHLYKTTTPTFDNFEAWHIANNVSWADKNSIYLVNPDGTEYDITHATEYQKYAVVEDITLTPDEDGTFVNGENCTYYPAAKQAGMKKHNAKVIPATGGTITVSYTHHDGTEVNDFTSGDIDLAHTCLLTITATPDAGYSLASLTVNDMPFTSGNVHTLTADAVIKATWTEKATPNFAWSDATCTAALEADNTFPTLSNPNSLSPVTYESSNTGVATIDANGNITLVATGPTTITAIGAETDTHKSATTSYELTVVESNCRWVETEIGDITFGDDVLITVPGTDGYGNPILNMLQDPQASKNPTIETMNVSDLLNGANVDATLIWNIRKRDDNQDNFTIYRNGSTTDRLVFVSSNGIRVGSSTSGSVDSIFTITTEGYLQSIQTLHNMRMSGSSDWRHYTTAGQTLKFYKRECLDATSYWVTWDAGDGVWTDGSSNKLESYQVGATITAPTENPTREGYRFDGWTPTPETMPAQNTTFTAQWTEVYKITWYENGVPSYTYVPSDNPVVTWEDDIADCGTKKFYGWTADDTFVSDPTTPPTCIEKGIRIAGDVTYYAVYADAEEPENPGYEKVTTISEGTYLIATGETENNKAYTGKYPEKTYGGTCDVIVENQVISTKPTSAVEVEVTLGTGANSGKFAIYDGTYYLSAPDNNNLTFNDNIVYDWKLTAEGHINSTGYSARYIQLNSSANPNRFACYSSSTQTKAYLYKKQTTTYKNFAVSCATYEITITPPTGGTVTTTPANEAGAGQTITVNVTPADCKYLTALKYNKYNDGSDYSINIASTPYTFTMPAADVTITATFADKTATDIEILTSAHRMLMQGSAFVGEQVRITYNNGDKETLNWNDSRLTFTGYNTATLGTQTVTVTYNDCGTQSASYNIEVIDGLGITFWDGNYTEVVKYEPGDLVDVDSRIGQNICSGWEFVGWSETKVANESNGFTPVHNFNATDAKVLYAVYAEIRMVKEGDVLKEQYKSADMVTDLQEGARYIVAAYVNSNNSSYGYTALTPNSKDTYYMAGTHTDNNGFAYTQERNDDNSNIYCTTYEIDSNNLWRIESDGDGYWQLFNIATKKYLDLSAHENQYLTTNNYPNGKIVIYDYISSIGDNDSRLELRHSTEESDGNKLYWDRTAEYFRQTVSTSDLSCIYCLTKDKSFTSTPPCSPLSATFHGNGGIVTDGVNSGDNLTITEPTRDAGITTPTASFADCNGKSWTFVGWSREEIDVTRVPVLTTDLLHDGGGNKHYYIQEDGEEFWAVYTNQGTPETKYGTITFTDADVTKQYENAKTITKSVTAMGDYDFELYRVSDASSKGIQFDHDNATRGYIKNITSLGKINSISFNDFQVGYISYVKVYVGNMPNAINTLLTEADLQQTGNTYTYYPPKNYAYVKIEATDYCGITSISIDFGKGTQIWATTPDCSTITLSGDEIYVTATNGRAVMAPATLTVKANQLEANADVILTSNSSDVYFSTDRTFNFAAGQAANQKPTTSLTLPTDAEGNLATTDVYIQYMPSSEGNGVPADVVISANLETPNPSITDDHTIHVRNLPAKFVIATKVGATWYALPANMTDDTNPLAEVIEVDEATMTATAPNTTTYTLWPVKTTNGTGNRYADYGDRLRFAAVNYEQRGLWANNNNNSSAIRNYAVINSLGADGTAAYEWKVTTTVVDGHWQYTLQTDQTQNQNYLRYWTSAEGTPVGPKWGTYNAGENRLYFLPVTETQPFEYDVVEWYPTKMLIQTDAAIASPTVKIRGEKVATPVLTSKGGKLYEISNLPLETNPNEVLQVSFTADAINYVNAKVVPIILSRGEKSITGEPFATLTQKVYQYADIVVRDGATLTIDGGTDVANTLLGMTIYPTAKVSVAEGKKLSVHNLTFFGGIDEIYDGSAYTINKYGVPQLSLKGILNKTITNMDYIMRVNLDQMYQVGVPYNVNLNDITYWDGTTMTLGEDLYISAYDGQKRANREEKSWVWEVNFTEPILKAGIGYTISADKQDAAHEYSIIRMPMKNNITSGNTETAKTVQVYAYDNTNDVKITDNHKGWNYLSNPYMVAISGAEADSKLVVGYLRETGTGPWEWVDDTYRYVTIPSDDGKWYDQQKFEEATLLPFKSFFLQIATSGELSFALASRQGAPARYLQSSNEQREVEFEVLLANDTRSDNLGFLIGEDYTPAYEINADLEKMIGSMSVYTIYNGYNLAYNALSPTNAAEQIPIGYVVPTVGEYTFALDESSDIEDVEHIYLIDYETSAITDLVTDVYTFTTLEQKSDTRFAINVALKSKDNTATGLDNMNTNSELPTKFIYQDKIYILHHGVIYDATGKRVITINK